MEERGLLKRAKRETKQATPPLRRDAGCRNRTARRKESPKDGPAGPRGPRQDAARAQRACRTNEGRGRAADGQDNPQPILASLLGCMPRAGGVPPYPTKGKVEIFPLCHGEFVRRKNGTLRKHDCVDPTPW
eukprot:2507349-Prymnesium_polylepis.1